MKVKKFKFSYGNSLNMVKTKVLRFISAVVFMMFIFYFWLINLGNIDYICRGDETAGKTILRPYLLSIVIIFLYLLAEAFLPQRIYVNSDLIKIKRYGFNIRYVCNAFTDKILICDIVSCNKYEGARSEKFLYKETSLYYDWDDLVEIRTGRFGKEKYYYIPIKDSQSFVDYVNSLKQ